MRKVQVLVLALVILGLLVGFQLGIVSAQPGRVCNPFTTTPDAGMLPVGQVVDFLHWEGSSVPVTRTGIIEAYYIASCFPGGTGIVGLDAQAYVVNYGSADGSRVVLNRISLTVR